VSSPEWFHEAVSAPRSDRSLIVQGGHIHFDTWQGSADKPGLLFVHGHAAHSHWWDFIAPALSADFNVAAIDLSGAGDSDHRDQYSAACFANEILEVGSALGSSNLYVIGHSFGGSMTRIAAFLHGAELAGIVLVDSAISRGHHGRHQPNRPTGRTRYYGSAEEAMQRFRLRPPQPCANDYILQYIARHSLRQTAQGYRFKLDQALFSKMVEIESVRLPDAVTMIGATSCPVGFIYGEHSQFFAAATVQLLEDAVDPQLRLMIPGAHHHVFLDQPLPFIEALRTILGRMR
jgi:pimeloyl-ACP methyl ester carboxylesterase